MFSPKYIRFLFDPRSSFLMQGLKIKGRVSIVGASVVELVTAWQFQRKGYHCTIFEKGSEGLSHGASYIAGGMLSPNCELESAESCVCDMAAPGTIRKKSDG